VIAPMTKNAHDEVVRPAGARVRERAEQHGQLQLAAGEAAEARDGLVEVAERLGADRRRQRDDEEHQHERDLDELEPLDRPVDDRGGGQHETDHEHRADRDRVCVPAAEQERGDRGGARRPRRPHVGDDRAGDHHQSERLPQPLEPGDRGLAGRERVALDLHVDEVLRQQADERRPQEDEADLRGDVREEDVLAGGDADADEDHARPHDPPQRRRGRELALHYGADAGLRDLRCLWWSCRRHVRIVPWGAAAQTPGRRSPIQMYVITYGPMAVPVESLPAIGPRVRALREAMDLSLRDLAERCGVSAPMLSQVERGETSPTLQVAARIAAGLELRLSQLLRLDEGGTVTVVRAGHGRRGGADGHRYEILSPPLPGQRAELSRHRLAPGAVTGGPGDPPMHEPGARETAVVEAGAVTLHVDGQRHELADGDCVTFDADLPHHFENHGKEEVVLLAIVSAGLRRS
jgi:transcriptional regulator with XRE-family HTH domain